MSDKKIENTLQVTGKSWLPEPLKVDREYQIRLVGTVNKKSYRSNEDGTYERKFNLQQDHIELVEVGRDIPIKAQGKKSRSKAMYNAWYNIWENENDPKYKKMEFQEFYDYVMAVSNGNLDDIWEFLKNNVIK